MNGDISLSQTLGGLRIANPDDDTSQSPSPPPPAPAISTSEATTTTDSADHLPPPSSHSSSSTVTARPRASSALASSASPPLGSSQNANPLSIINTSLQHSPTQKGDNAIHNTRWSRGPASLPMPLGHQEQRQMQFPNAPQNRSYPPPSAATARPLSVADIYNHPNVSSSSAASTHSYRYRDDPGPPPQPPSIGMHRSGSTRKSAAAIQQLQAGIASQDASYMDRAYLQTQAIHGGNGPAPPRRSSKRVSPTGPVTPGAPMLSPQLAVSPYAPEGGPPPSSEEWKERGAAVGIRQEVRANGEIINRPVKKGVKDFNFGRTLGEGSYSTVMAATDRQTGREYAIKVLDKRHIIKEKKVKYVNIEKDTLNRLTDHPGIVRLYYTFQDERSLYFVLDLASGGELLGVLKKYTTFDMECTRFYGAQILDSVCYMHSRGVIHRDLKPENVLLDSHMHVKITDFGTAKILENTASNGIVPIPGDPMDGVGETDRAMSFVGTAEYVSPELLTDKNACKASDLWAFGCIIYQLLAGRPPFKAANEYQTFQKIVALDYVFPDGFPEVARDLVERLLVLDPARRLPMEHIKNHQFFDGVAWGKGLWKLKAPRLKSYSPPAPETIRLNGPQVSAATSTSQLRPVQPRLITELPPPSQLDIEWSPVLTRTNERILKLGNLIVTSAPPTGPHANGEAKVDTPNKFQRFFGSSTLKRRQRLVMVTSSAHLVMAAAGGDEKKAKLDINLLGQGCAWRSYKDSKGLTVWCLDTKDKHLIFEDPKVTSPADPTGSQWSTQEWLDSLAQARDFALSQSSLAHSYSGDNDLSSTISSPTGSIGGAGGVGAAGHSGEIEGVNVPRGLMRKKDRADAAGDGGGDNESVRSLGKGGGRKRFSRRQSKSGLAAVF